MKAAAAICLLLCSIQTSVFAKENIEFVFPDAGWHKTACPAEVNKDSDCYASYGNKDMIIFFEKDNESALNALNNHLETVKQSYGSIELEYISRKENDAMVIWCCKEKNICSVTRAFKGRHAVIFAVYIDKMPHYSRNLFLRMNIPANVKVKT